MRGVNNAYPSVFFPVKGSIITPLTKVVQGSQEDYSDFVSHLLEVAEQTQEQESSDNRLIKQLAYENANVVFRATLWGKYRDKDLNQKIRLCREVDPFSRKMSQAVHLAVGEALQPVLAVGAAFQ